MDERLLTRAISGSIMRAVSFGLYSASFVHSVRWLLFEDEGWRVRKKVSWIMMATTLLIFFLSMGLFCGGWMKRFTISGPLRPIIWSLDILDCSGFQCSILIVIDAILIYRCWAVCSKKWFMVAFPLVLWSFCLICATLSFSCNIKYLLFLRGSHSQDFELKRCFMPYDSVVPLAFYTSNIVINAYTTFVLVYKIWCAFKNNGRTNRLYKISRILAESGVLYTLSSVIYLVSWIRNYTIISQQPAEYAESTDSFLLQPFAAQIAMNLSMFVPGIAFNLIIIRVGEQRANEENTWVGSGEPSEGKLSSHGDQTTEIGVASPILTSTTPCGY